MATWHVFCCLFADMDPLDRLGEFSEAGRGLPLLLSRPAAALPTSPLVRQAYAPTPRARLGWAQGTILVSEVRLDAPCAIGPEAPLAEAARCLVRDDAGFVPVVEAGRFFGVVYLEEVLAAVADHKQISHVRSIVSTQIPTCAPYSELVDAVRQMIATWMRRIPVVGDGGELIGMLALSSAAAAAERDPATRAALDGVAELPALFARRWR